MKINFEMIDSDLRSSGRIFRFLLNDFTPAKLRLANWMMLNFRMPLRSDKIRITQEWLPRQDGSKIRAVIFSPLERQQSIPGVLWLHGGGYAIGSPEESIFFAQELISASPCVVIAPEYRLSVQAPYPAALDDAYDSLLWMKSNTTRLGIRADQLMVGGDSAGGGLTAALTHYARDKGEVALAFQMPLYPMLDDRMKAASAADNNAPVWSSISNANAWKLYLGELFGRQDVPQYAAPSRAENYHNLPPAVTFVGDLEPFRDETIAYVEDLRKAGGVVDFEMFPGCYHAFEQMVPKAAVSRRAMQFWLRSYQHAVENYFTK